MAIVWYRLCLGGGNQAHVYRLESFDEKEYSMGKGTSIPAAEMYPLCTHCVYTLC